MQSSPIFHSVAAPYHSCPPPRLTVVPLCSCRVVGVPGVTIRFDCYENADEHLVRVLEVVPNSPAELAGLQPNLDFLLGTAEMSFRGKQHPTTHRNCYTSRGQRTCIMRKASRRHKAVSLLFDSLTRTLPLVPTSTLTSRQVCAASDVRWIDSASLCGVCVGGFDSSPLSVCVLCTYICVWCRRGRAGGGADQEPGPHGGPVRVQHRDRHGAHHHHHADPQVGRQRLPGGRGGARVPARPARQLHRQQRYATHSIEAWPCLVSEASIESPKAVPRPAD
jgi:hypothetical protein